MSRAGVAGNGYLALDDVAEDPQVARRLPPELAWRLHALPVAEDNGQLTVAMANPDDPGARDAVVAALGPVACVVRADPDVIDSHLARIWGESATRPLDLIACCFPQPMTDEVWTYAEAVGNLLGARLSRADTQDKLEAMLGEHGPAQADVVLFGDARHPSISDCLARAAATEQAEAQPAPAALWVAPQPRWPLHRILLVMGGTVADQAAVDWVVRVARPGISTVTILTIVPPAPAMYGQRGRMDQGLPALLTSASPLGQQMRDAAHRLVECQIEATLRLRAGPPQWQVCHEIVKGDHDLVVLAVERPHRWLRWIEGEMIGPLLNRIDRPFLITAATTCHEPPG
ncbi:MAG: universal stress protein [Anaerolineae bacterium]|nr:universal stress protein [Anaerolineae bacterium]